MAAPGGGGVGELVCGGGLAHYCGLEDGAIHQGLQLGCDRSRLAMSVICTYYELGHLVGGGRREAWATNSKLRQNKEEDEVRGRRMGNDFSTNMPGYIQ